MTGDEPGTRIITIPNVLSLLRLLSVPVFLILWGSDHEGPAVAVFVVSASTDFLDGYIARRTGSVTKLGALLDPLADRVFIVALAIALVARDVLPLWLAAVILVRDVAILALWPIVEGKGIPRIAVNFVGKVATACLLFGLTLMAVSETSFVWADEGEGTGLGFAIVGAALYWTAGAMYAREALAGLRAVAAERSKS